MKCKKCKHQISLILDPITKFKDQLKAIFSGYCSVRCYNTKRGK